MVSDLELKANNGIWRGRKLSPNFLAQLFLVLAALTIILSVQTKFENSGHTSTKYAIDSDLLPHLVLGYKLFASDLLWVRVLQEIDYKDEGKISKGWAFHLLDSATIMDPRWRLLYPIGGSALSILIGDTDGASIIWKRAAENFPHDWPILYYGGYHFLYEAKDCTTAAKFFEQAVQNGAPPWVAALSGRLYAKTGQYEIAKSVLEDTLERFKNSPYEEHIRQRLKELDEHNQEVLLGKSTALVDCK